MFYNKSNLLAGLSKFKGGNPFDFCIIDDFLDIDISNKLEKEFLSYEDKRWFYYQNAIEDKKALNDWNAFPEYTYKLFNILNSQEFVEILSNELDVPLFSDPGLHGGGWHMHSAGGNLNPHLDYSIHPKVGLQRKLNIIIYLSSELKEEHGGHLGLWSHNNITNGPGKLITEVQPKFNRAIIFDTTQNSWHGMSRPLIQPENIFRKSLAAYFLTTPPEDVDERQRALFAPRENQIGDENVETLIKTRADSKNFSKAYKT